MKQYCRYCGSCIFGDCYYCTDKQRVLTESEVKRANHCDSFNLSDLGDVDTGKQYKPKEPKRKQCEGQVSLW